MTLITPSCLAKQEALKALFLICPSDEARYHLIIRLGQKSIPQASRARLEGTRVNGCQSELYLYAALANEKMIFETASDALISAGLAVLLTRVYHDEPPQCILGTPPEYLKELGILTRLSPSRANGLYQIHKQMQQSALKLCISQL